jgi:hypothetical protein
MGKLRAAVGVGRDQRRPVGGVALEVVDPRAPRWRAALAERVDVGPVARLWPAPGVEVETVLARPRRQPGGAVLDRGDGVPGGQGATLAQVVG